MKRGGFAEEQVIGVLIEVDTPITEVERRLPASGCSGCWNGSGKPTDCPGVGAGQWTGVHRQGAGGLDEANTGEAALHHPG